MYFKEEIRDIIMDITEFNKELGKKIAIAQIFEKKGEIQAAIQQWVDISEMALNFSKSPKINASFKNMIINRTKGIFAHIRELKARQFKEEMYIEDLEPLQEDADVETSSQMDQNEENLPKDVEQENFRKENQPVIVEDSDLKNMPKGFKEIQTSEDFTIITPHDEKFVPKQKAKAEESKFFKPKIQEISDVEPQTSDSIEFEQSEKDSNLICFACGYDKNTLNDKTCKNCGIDLN